MIRGTGQKRLRTMVVILTLIGAWETLARAGDSAAVADKQPDARSKSKIWLVGSLQQRVEVLGLRGFEQLSRGFRYTLRLRSIGAPIAPRDLLGQRLTVAVRGHEARVRYVNGYVMAVDRAVDDVASNSYVYELALQPWIDLLRKVASFEVFHDMSYPKVVSRVFRRRRFADFRFALSSRLPKRPQTVQYRETDRNFVDRLLEQVGISYYFEHGKDGHRMVLIDGSRNRSRIPKQRRLSLDPATVSPRQLRRWSSEHKLGSTRYTLKDYNFQHGDTVEMIGTHGFGRYQGLGDLEIYDFPGEYDHPKDAAIVARLRAEETAAALEVGSAEVQTVAINVGQVIEIDGVPGPGDKARHLVTRADLNVGVMNDGDVHFSTDLWTIPAKTRIRPARVTPKPVINGARIGIVVGPKVGEPADPLGRVNVRFTWARDDQGRASSIWMRVLQPPSREADTSGLALPRVGQEVLVQFEEGDPDRPIVGGLLVPGAQR